MRLLLGVLVNEERTLMKQASRFNVGLEKTAATPEPKYLYRGVHANHPAVEEARLGHVYPGDPDGTITPAQHNVGGVSAISPYTSWTRNEEVARTHANDRGAGGVILRLAKTDSPDAATSSWVESPNELHWEEEELLLGYTLDAEVVYGKQPRSPPKQARPRDRR